MTDKPIVVAFPFIGDEIGGSHISAVRLISGLDRTAFDPVAILHRFGDVLERYLADHGIRYIRSPETPVLSPAHRMPEQGPLATGVRYAVALPGLVRFLKSQRIDIVHTNDGRMHATWALPARLAGAKLLWHHRGDPGAAGANMLAPILANQIVTVSQFARPSRPILPIGSRVSVIHSPFDHPSVLPDRQASRLDLCTELSLSSDSRFAGYFGGLIDRKRPLLFVDAIAAYLGRHPDTPLHGVLFGLPEINGPRLDLAVKDRARKLGIAGNIHLMGFRSPVAPAMRAVDVLLVPAINEPFGRTLIEAMLLGTPVVATDHGGNREAIRDGQNGLLVSAEDAEAFVAPLHRLLADPCAWRRISEQAREEALGRYGASAHIESVASLYRRMLGRG